MRRTLTTALACGTLVATGAAFGGCGGATKTVTASEAPSGGETTASSSARSTGTQRTTTATQTTQTTNTAPASSSGSSAAGSTTRTAPEPAFTEHGGTGGPETTGAEAAAAVAAVKARGYTPNDSSEYHAGQTLRVLTATRTGSADGYAQRAFFFLDGRYIGTDASAPSASVRVVSQGDTEVVLAYALYREHDPLCCPGGGEATVHFQLNDGRLVALQPIPPVSSASGLSRQ